MHHLSIDLQLRDDLNEPIYSLSVGNGSARASITIGDSDFVANRLKTLHGDLLKRVQTVEAPYRLLTDFDIWLEWDYSIRWEDKGAIISFIIINDFEDLDICRSMINILILNSDLDCLCEELDNFIKGHQTKIRWHS